MSGGIKEKQQMDNQTKQTQKSFNEKWTKNSNLALEATISEGSTVFNWILNRNGFANLTEFKAFLSGKKRILDGGCGNGRVTKLLRMHSNPETTEVVGIDFSSHEVAKENLKNESNLKVQFGNLREDLSSLGLFDFIYCQEVLHHTGDARSSFKNLCQILEPNGEIAIYVYKEKAPIREFTDDFIRDKISALSYEDSMKACRQITELSKTLTELEVSFDSPAVDVLDIPAGNYSIQRFLYHFFMKCFWNNEFSFEDNAVINYDWYHPQDCTRHSIEEVELWFAENNIKINHKFVDFYGITVKGMKVK